MRRVSKIGLGVTERVAATLAMCVALITLGACGQSAGNGWDSGVSSSSSSGGGIGSSSGSSSGQSNVAPPVDDGGAGGLGCIHCLDATVDAGTDSAPPPSSSSGGPFVPQPAMGTIPAADCPGCTTFPPTTAPACPSTAPQITIVYPTDTVLVPPNMNVISVHWTPFGAPYTQFSVDFTNAPLTDWHIITKCANQTIDAQSNTPSGGCELVIDPVSWSKLVGSARGSQVLITVRGTTDGMCSTASTNQIHMNFAEEDLLGTYYYWQSTITVGQGTGGQIWKKTFGDLTTPEQDVTTNAINATCNGCHSLSRDGTRMVVYSDDNDSDDEYSDIAGSYLDMTTNPATELPGGVTQGGHRGGGQPAGFSTIDPNVTAGTTATAQGYYVTSNGYPCAPGTGACGSATTGYTSAVPLNGFSVWNGTTGAFINGVPVGAAGTRPTMPDWSPDGKSIVYVQPTGEFTSWRTDDAHIYGGSLYTVPYNGMGAFGAAALLLQSAGENNYYPSYSPDVPMSYVIFNRVDNMNAGMNCTNTGTGNGTCLDDSFSNPAARLMLLAAPGSMMAGSTATPIDLEKANGSPITAKVPWSNSYPRWAPFVQKYKGNKLLWFTFSSTRDYGARVINQNNSPNSPTLKKSGMYQCYPADAAETSQPPANGHSQLFAPGCQEPQLWMAPLFFSEAQGGKDPSGVALWIPYQKITTHNHTAQWTQQIVPPPVIVNPPPPTCMCQPMVYGACGVANGGCGCCVGNGLCTGNNICFTPPP